MTTSPAGSSGAPAVSIVLPARDAEQTLAAAARSVLNQTERDLELIVVDDGSRDRTQQVIAALAASDARVRALRVERLGLVAALGAGLGAARGRFIARMDADDESHPERLARQRRALQERPEVGLVGCAVRFGGDPAAAAGFARYVAWSNGLCGAEAIARARFIESPLVHPTFFFRRELLDAHGGYREGDFPEDYELLLRWIDAGVRVEKLAEPLLTWNDPPRRLTRTDARYRPEAFYATKAEWLARWLARHNPRHPEVIVWGAGRPTRRRAEALIAHGVRIAAWVDIDAKKTGRTVAGRPVLRPEELPPRGECFVVPYVGKRGARELIVAELERRGMREGEDFICAA